jgi:hypothetical protein
MAVTTTALKHGNAKSGRENLKPSENEILPIRLKFAAVFLTARN